MTEKQVLIKNGLRSGEVARVEQEEGAMLCVRLADDQVVYYGDWEVEVIE